MRWYGIAIAAMVGCGPKAQPVEPVAQSAPLAKPVITSWRVGHFRQPRPEIDVSPYLPDFHDDLRWPLSGMRHPSLEPRFPIASVFADPGIGWHELCARGVHLRTSATHKEQLAYLRGWCAMARDDAGTAIGHLVPLLGSLTPGMRAAVREDIVHMLVASGGADTAERWLTRYDLRDIAVLDQLAAIYADMDLANDAVQITRRAIDSDVNPPPATRCRRLVRLVVLDSEAPLAIRELERLASAAVPDPTCKRLHNKVACSRTPSHDCADYHLDENLSADAQALLRVYFRWPSEMTPWSLWLALAQDAAWAISLPRADELAVTALEAALRGKGTCDEDLSIGVHHVIDTALFASPPPLAARVEKLRAACPVRPLPTRAPGQAPRSVTTPVQPPLDHR